MNRKEYDAKREAGANAGFTGIATFINDSLIKDEYIASLEASIAELEQELKNQVELHNEWLGTYRIKLNYIEELERKIKRLTT